MKDPASSDPRVTPRGSPDLRPGNGKHDASAEGGKDPLQALKDLGTHFAELKNYASLLLATKVDGVKASLRRVVLFATAGVLGLVMGCAMVVGGAVYFFRGIAEGLTELFGGRAWLGDLTAGLVLLAIVGLGVVLGLSVANRASRKATFRKYEERRVVQRPFGSVSGGKQGRTEAH